MHANIPPLTCDRPKIRVRLVLHIKPRFGAFDALRRRRWRRRRRRCWKMTPRACCRRRRVRLLSASYALERAWSVSRRNCICWRFEQTIKNNNMRNAEHMNKQITNASMAHFPKHERRNAIRRKRARRDNSDVSCFLCVFSTESLMLVPNHLGSKWEYGRTVAVRNLSHKYWYTQEICTCCPMNWWCDPSAYASTTYEHYNFNTSQKPIVGLMMSSTATEGKHIAHYVGLMRRIFVRRITRNDVRTWHASPYNALSMKRIPAARMQLHSIHRIAIERVFHMYYTNHARYQFYCPAHPARRRDPTVAQLPTTNIAYNKMRIQIAHQICLVRSAPLTW